MQLGDANYILRTYNQLASALTKFEMIWLRAWGGSISSLRPALCACIFVRHPETKGIYINFDRAIPQMIHECKTLQQMGIKASALSNVLSLLTN